eukprot:UN04631
MNDLEWLSARRANFFSAVGKILDLVSVIWEAKNEPKIEIQMKCCRVSNISLGGCQN